MGQEEKVNLNGFDSNGVPMKAFTLYTSHVRYIPNNRLIGGLHKKAHIWIQGIVLHS